MNGVFGWLGLVIWVFYWDLTQETMSDAFWRGLESNWRFVLVPLWILLTVHLFQLVPRKYDLFWYIGTGIYRVLGVR